MARRARRWAPQRAPHAAGKLDWPTAATARLSLGSRFAFSGRARSLQPLTAPDIALPERKEYTSNLVKLAVEAEGMAISESNPVQLFW